MKTLFTIWLLIFSAGFHEILAQGETEKQASDAGQLVDPQSELQSIIGSLNKFQELYTSIKTLEYTATRRATDSKHDPSLLPESIHFLAEGEKYWYDFNSVRRPGDDSFCFISSYNGEYTRKFSKDNGYLTNQKGVGSDGGTLFGHNYFFLPQSFMFSEYNPNSGFIARPKILSDPKTWNNFIDHIKLEGNVMILGKACISTEIEIKQEFATSLPAKIRIFLDPKLGYYPLGWDILTTDKKPIAVYRVTELGYCNIPGSPLSVPYPKTATRISYVKDNKVVSDISSSSQIVISDVHINELVDPDRLDIDPAIASGVYDVDSQTYIAVPK